MIFHLASSIRVSNDNTSIYPCQKTFARTSLTLASCQDPELSCVEFALRTCDTIYIYVFVQYTVYGTSVQARMVSKAFQFSETDVFFS